MGESSSCVHVQEEEEDNIAHQVDDFYFSALADADQLFPISDENYAQELQLQEALMSAVVTSTRLALSPSPPARPCREKVESSSSSSSALMKSSVFCKICMEVALESEMFQNGTCSHAFCRDCLSRHIGAKIQENIWEVMCPEVGCKGVLEPESCRVILPHEVFERWADALCESMVLGSQKFYCPFKDCSALMVDDGGVKVMESECPCCRRLFCAQCRVAWHAELSCEQYGSLEAGGKGMEDILLMQAADRNKWRRCPSCKYFVEKTEGCAHITCRCKFQFCYICGGKWSIYHACSGGGGGVRRTR